MALKQLNPDQNIKCECNSCKGTGIIKHYFNDDYNKLGVICYDCNGKGFFNFKSIDNDIAVFVQDEDNGMVYKLIDAVIVEKGKLFDKLKTVEDIDYVVYASGFVAPIEHMFKHGAKLENILTYKEFLAGQLPLPFTKYLCPKIMQQSYYLPYFSDDCCDYNRVFSSIENCPKYGTDYCWEKAYGDATTVEEKQQVLRKIK